MEVTATHLGDSKFEIAVRAHRIVCDQPLESGGADAGMSPPEFLLASLATCAGYYAAQYLKTRGLVVQSLSIRVVAEKAQHPTRLDPFRIELMAPGLDRPHEAGILRSVKACLIHNTLLGRPKIEVLLRSASPSETTQLGIP